MIYSVTASRRELCWIMASNQQDPLERMVAEALDAAGIPYVSERGGANPSRLDFMLPELGIEIEVKRFHSERLAEQMSRAPNVIALQGEPAVRWFCNLLKV